MRTETLPDSSDPTMSGLAAVGLHFVDDRRPGYRRMRRGGGFVYVDTRGKPIHDEGTLTRIKRLAIPPAYRDVWISTDPEGHLQATGRDARGRKQYRYHPRWREWRDETKYGRLLAFASALPRIRKQVEADLRLPGLPRARVLAVVVRLLDMTLVRVGNEKYARSNRSFGLTTLRDRHAHIKGDEIQFRFRGKSGVDHEVRISDSRLARLIKKCMDIPGQELFQYLEEDGSHRPVDSGDVNEYLRAASGADFTAKDYRTWAGTVFAFRILSERLQAGARCDRTCVTAAIREVASRLSNTPAVCKRCYVHPIVIERFLAQDLPPWRSRATPRALRPDERSLYHFLKSLPLPEDALRSDLQRSLKAARGRAGRAAHRS